MGPTTVYLLGFLGAGVFFGWLAHASMRDGKAWGLTTPNDRTTHPVRFWLGVGAHVLMTCLCTFGFLWSATGGL